LVILPPMEILFPTQPHIFSFVFSPRNPISATVGLLAEIEVPRYFMGFLFSCPRVVSCTQFSLAH
jgi:hypothetical protein